MINEIGYDYEPFQGSHEDEFFDWYIAMHGMIDDGASPADAVQYLKLMQAPNWVVTRLLNGEIEKGI